VELDVGTGAVRNHTRGLGLQVRPYTPEMLEIVRQGGLLEVLRRRVEAEGVARGAARSLLLPCSRATFGPNGARSCTATPSYDPAMR